jgi:hypothetical protein
MGDILRKDLTEIGEKVCSQDVGLREVGDKWSKLEPVGRGEGRTVLRLDGNLFGEDVVVKFAHNRSRHKGGVDQNQYEAFIWNNASVHERELLAPVMDSHKYGLWLVMQYAESVPESFDLEPKRDEIYDAFGKRVDSTFRRRNFGVIDSNVKLIDYGYSMNK